MKRSLVMLALVVLVTGCGALRINPKSCKTDALWGASPTSSREIKKEEVGEEKVIDIKAKDSFYVFSDRDLRLRDLLEEHGIKCEQVKKIRVVVETSWFIKREVLLKVVTK